MSYHDDGILYDVYIRNKLMIKFQYESHLLIHDSHSAWSKRLSHIQSKNHSFYCFISIVGISLCLNKNKFKKTLITNK